MARRQEQRSTDNDETLCDRCAPGAYDPQQIRGAETIPRLSGAQSLEALRGLSPVALVALEIIAEAGGFKEIPAFESLLTQRTGLEPGQFKRTVGELESAHLVLMGKTLDRYSLQRREIIALLRPGAGTVARAVRGITLPRPPPPETPPGSRGPARAATRDAVAILCGLAHAPVRFTKDGHAHSTGLKKYAASVGLQPAAMEQVIDRARIRRSLGARGDLLAPLPLVIRRALDSLPYQPRSPLARVTDWLAPGHWTSVDGVVRAFDCLTQRASITSHSSTAASHASLSTSIQQHPLLEFVEVDGHSFVRRASSPTLRGDGHVTPGFEVMLGPDASPELTLTIALGAQLVRIDRVITLRITAASVAGGMACGLDANEFLSALGRVGRAPVPENVAVMVRDWSAAARPAQLQRAWTLTVAPELAQRVAREIGEEFVTIARDGLLVIDHRVSERDIGAALKRCKIPRAEIISLDAATRARYEGAYDAPDSLDDDDPEPTDFDEPAPLPPPPLPLGFEGAADLATRVREQLRKSVAQLAATATAGPVPPVKAVRVQPPRTRESVANQPVDQRLDAALRRLSGEVASDVAKFAAKLTGTERVDFTERSANPLSLVPWSLLAWKWRSRAAEVAESEDGLDDIAWEVVEDNRVSDAGRAFLELLAVPDIKRAIGARVDIDTFGSLLEMAAICSIDVADSEPVAAAPDSKQAPAEERVDVTEDAAQFVRVFSEAASRGARVGIVPRRGGPTYIVRAQSVSGAGQAARLLGIDEDEDRGRSFPIDRVAKLVVYGE